MPLSLPAETIVCLVLSMALALMPLVLFYQAPVAFAHLVAEDFAGEYATSAAFAAAGVIFCLDAVRTPRRTRQLIGLAIGLVAILIAGEEVSWGERQLRHLFGFEVPATLRAANLQGEMNLHNLELVAPAMTRAGQIAGSILLVVWLILSAWSCVLRPDAASRLRSLGVPLVPPRLAPLCLLPVLFFVARPGRTRWAS